jgi:hypothetical protein
MLMWSQAPFRADDWLLYEMTSPHAAEGRALVFGNLWRKDTGELVCSCAQQGVVRLARPSIARTAADVGWRGAHLLGQLKTLVLGRQ